MKTISLIFIIILALSVGAYSLIKYMEDTHTETMGWKGLPILLGHAVLSIIIVPVAIAKWAVNTTVEFKKEDK